MDSAEAVDLARLLLVLSAGLWLGAIVTCDMLLKRVRGRENDAEIVGTALDCGWIARWLITPSAIVAALAGGYIFYESGDDFVGWWSAVGSLWLVAFVGSTTTRSPSAKIIAKLALERGPEDEEVQWRARRIHLIGRGEILVLAVAIALGTLKPF